MGNNKEESLGVEDEGVKVNIGDLEGLAEKYGVEIIIYNELIEYESDSNQLRVKLYLKMGSYDQLKMLRPRKELQDLGWEQLGDYRNRYEKIIILKG